MSGFMCLRHIGAIRHTFRDRLRASGCPLEMIDQIGGWSFIGTIGSKYGQGYDLDALRKHLSVISLSWNSIKAALSNPDDLAISISYIDAVLGADPSYPLFPYASSIPRFLARIMHSECMNFFHWTHGAAILPPYLWLCRSFYFSRIALLVTRLG